MFFSSSKDPRELKRRAESLARKQKWDKALEAYLDMGPDAERDPRILMRMAELHLKLQDDGKAMLRYKRAGKIFLGEGFWAKAMAVSQLVKSIAPADEELDRMIAKKMAPPDDAQEAAKNLHGAKGLVDTGGDVIEMDGLDMTVEGVSAQEGAQSSQASSQEENPGGGTTMLEFDEEGFTQDTDRPTHTLGERMTHVPLFSNLRANQIEALLSKLKVVRYAEGDWVLYEGEAAGSMFIIAEGRVEVSIKDHEGMSNVLARLEGGSFFGEFSLLMREPRNASVQAKTDLELLEIGQNDLDAMANDHPEIWPVLETYLKERMVGNLLAKSPVFCDLSVQERQKFVDALVTRKVESGEHVLEAGTEGEEMFFIKRGTFSVLLPSDEGLVKAAELDRCHAFGEIAMLTGDKRAATIRAETPGEVFLLRRAQARSIFGENKDVLRNLKTLIDERKAQNRALTESFEEAKVTLDLV